MSTKKQLEHKGHCFGTWPSALYCTVFNYKSNKNLWVSYDDKNVFMVRNFGGCQKYQNFYTFTQYNVLRWHDIQISKH